MFDDIRQKIISAHGSLHLAFLAWDKSGEGKLTKSRLRIGLRQCRNTINERDIEKFMTHLFPFPTIEDDSDKITFNQLFQALHLGETNFPKLKSFSSSSTATSTTINNNDPNSNSKRKSMLVVDEETFQEMNLENVEGEETKSNLLDTIISPSVTSTVITPGAQTPTNMENPTTPMTNDTPFIGTNRKLDFDVSVDNDSLEVRAGLPTIPFQTPNSPKQKSVAVVGAVSDFIPPYAQRQSPPAVSSPIASFGISPQLSKRYTFRSDIPYPNKFNPLKEGSSVPVFSRSFASPSSPSNINHLSPSSQQHTTSFNPGSNTEAASLRLSSSANSSSAGNDGTPPFAISPFVRKNNSGVMKVRSVTSPSMQVLSRQSLRENVEREVLPRGVVSSALDPLVKAELRATLLSMASDTPSSPMTSVVTPSDLRRSLHHCDPNLTSEEIRVLSKALMGGSNSPQKVKITSVLESLDALI